MSGARRRTFSAPSLRQAASCDLRPHRRNSVGVAPRPWSLGGRRQSGKSEAAIDDISTPEFVRYALNAGFSKDDLLQAEAALNNDDASSSLPRRIMDAVAAQHTGRKPWVGPLPKPRRSPAITIGDVQVTFKKTNKKIESSSTGSLSGKRPAGEGRRR